MSNLESIGSLMDLAALDTSDMKAQVSRLPAQGIYIIDLEELRLAEQPSQDPALPMSYTLAIKGTVLAFTPLDETQSSEGMEGRTLSERFFLYGKELEEAIALLMGRFKIVGFRHKGTMGGVENCEPGWIEDAIGKRVAVRVNHYARKDGAGDQAAFNWLGIKALEKADMTWDMMARPFLDENGEIADEAVNESYLIQDIEEATTD